MIEACTHFLSSSGGLVGVLFMAGLVGGFTHCAGMCGPFVLAQGIRGGDSLLTKLSGAALLPYHAGRITTYVTLAVLMNTVLNLAFAASPLRQMIAAPLLMFAGVIFLVTAFPRLAALFPWAAGQGLPFPLQRVTTMAGRLAVNPDIFRRYTLGVLLGFLPCGLVLSALLAASTAAHGWQAALGMAVFGLGTIPALFATALGGQMVQNVFPRLTGYAVRGMMVFNGLWLMAMAISLWR